MKYLIITKNNQPFYTEWFYSENHFNKEDMICVFDLLERKHTFDGKTWIETEVDHL
jgi:hypothetical protein